MKQKRRRKFWIEPGEPGYDDEPAAPLPGQPAPASANDAEAPPTDDEIQAAIEYWKRNAPEEATGLIDAETID